MELSVDSTCGSLLRELQHIWDEVGESDSDRDKMLLQLEQDCLDVYRRKVDHADKSRAELRQAIAEAEAEIAHVVSTLGEPVAHSRVDTKSSTLKEKLSAVLPVLEELRKKKEERLILFREVKSKIKQTLIEIAGSTCVDASIFDDTAEDNLSQARLAEYHSHLKALEKEKTDRLQKVNEYIESVKDLCSVLAEDIVKTLSKVNPCLVESPAGNSGVITDEALNGLQAIIQTLSEEKRRRLRKLKESCSLLIKLWNLMDTSEEERKCFLHITNVAEMVENDISAPGILSNANIQKVEDEVKRLDKLKVNKMRELVSKKHAELLQICIEAHMQPTADCSLDMFMSIIESGMFDASNLLSKMDELIASARNEAFSRKEIMDKMDKWIAACEEESWLEDYNQDENRYNASRGAHINLKRAEKARITIQKLPVMIDSLVQKTKAWELEHGKEFFYDQIRLLDVLEEQSQQRKEKEQERKRMRDQKKLQEQLTHDQESVYTARPSPLKPQSAKKGLSVRPNSNTPVPNRRMSLGGATLPADFPKKAGVTPVRSVKKDKTRPAAPVNYVAIAKEDTL